MIRLLLGALAYWPRRAWRCLTEDGWKAAVCRVLGIAVAFGIGGLLFIALGLPSIAANQPHWPVTRVFLEMVMTHTVRMRTLGKNVPPLDEPALVLKGAGHYATGCAPCHGAPGQPRSLIARQMLPTPPLLEKDVQNLDPAAMFWIVKHGLKYTAMPAWPAPKREDEVWAMVAFLKQLPELDPVEYRRLAYGDATPEAGIGRDGAFLSTLAMPPQTTLDNCARCHGDDGLGRGTGAFPKLAGQREAYLYASLQAFARGERHSGVMQPIAAGLSDAQMRALARHYASLANTGIGPVVGAAKLRTVADPAAIARGRTIATDGIGERRIPACRHCHGPGAVARNSVYPDLAGQYADYLALQLELFQQGHRGGTAYAPIMHITAATLSADEIDALAAYYASAPSQPPAAP
ncbi:c-type cytochrome [Lysobacter korlensis]|uniref:C-type cytochrome n=1 Tax=Lysobacter korlensis TaxID=553636 RepID=A0ABV6RIS5_9GAMM